MTQQGLHIETTQRPPVKRALLIALQYPGKKHSLQYTYEDADNLRGVLIDLFQFKPEDITVLKDDGKGVEPNREAILDHMRKLVADSIPGDRFVFHFSGHGAQRENEGHDIEDDGMDETIWPADVQVDDNGNVRNDIIDDVLSDTLLPSVCVDARLVIIFDSCHSGTAADLDHWSEDHKDHHPKKYRPSRRSKALNLGKNARAWSPVTSIGSGQSSQKSLESALQPMEDGTETSDDVVTLPETPRIVSWAACGDPQSAGSLPNFGGLFVRVFTNALRQAVEHAGFTHDELLKVVDNLMIETLVNKFPVKEEQARNSMREQLQKSELRPKPQLLGLPNLDDVRKLYINEMF